MIRNTLTACTALLALSTTAHADDVVWSGFLDNGTVGGVQDDTAAAHYLAGNLACEHPIYAVKSVVPNMAYAAGTTWTPIDVLAQDDGEGVKCINADQADLRCNNYSVNFACPAGSIDVGDFEIEYDVDDLSMGASGEWLVSGPVELVFGEYYLSFDDADLELEYADGHFELVSAVVRGGFGSNLGPLSGNNLLLGDGTVDVTLGYGDYSVIEALETPLNPEVDVKYIFLSVSAALLGGDTFDLTDELALEPASAEATVVIDPTTPTLYGYVDIGDLFTGSPLPVTVDTLGIGVSARDDAFIWSPTTDPYATLTLYQIAYGVPRTVEGNMWFEGGLQVGLAGIIGVLIEAEAIAQVDWDALMAGSLDFLHDVAVNGDFDIDLNLAVASMNFDVGTGTLRYCGDDCGPFDSLLLINGEVDPAEMLLNNGLNDFLEHVHGAAEVLFTDDTFRSVKADAELDFGLANFGATADVDITISQDSLIASGELDFGVTDLDVTVMSFSQGMLVDGSLEAGWGNSTWGAWGRLSVSGGTGGLDVEAEGKGCVGICTGWIGVSLSFSGGGFSCCIEVAGEDVCVDF